MKKKKTGWIWIVVIVVMLAGGFALSQALQPKPNANAQLYEAVKATRQDLKVTVHGTGSIAAEDTATVTAGASGRVQTLNVENGDAVKKGDVIATLDAGTLNDTISSLKEQIITQDATIAQLRVMPTYQYLTAPVDARVLAVYAKEGDNANVSMSAHGALMLLSTDGNSKVEFVPLAPVTAGQKVKAAIGGKTVNAFISTTPDSTTDKAVALVPGDTYSVGAETAIQDAKGAALGAGKLEANKPLLVTAYSGTADHIYVKAGDDVRKGRKLVKLSGDILDANFNSQLEKRQQLEDDLNKALEDLKDYSITADEDGIVSDLMLQAGAAAQEGMAVCSIQSTAGYKLVVAVDELDIPAITLGQKAEVKIDALPKVTATGTVEKISPLGVKVNDVTTYDVTLKVDAPAGTLVNMSASADVEVAFKAGALTVPVEALHTVDGRTFLYGALPGDIRGSEAAAGPGRGVLAAMMGDRSAPANDPKLKRQAIEVTVGLISDTSAEILSGLNEGDEVAVPYTQQDLASSMFGFGGNRGGNINNEGKPAAPSSAGNASN